MVWHFVVVLDRVRPLLLVFELDDAPLSETQTQALAQRSTNNLEIQGGDGGKQNPIFVLELSNSFYRMNLYCVGEIGYPSFPSGCYRRGPVSLRIV
jgi:hypothetical protein